MTRDARAKLASIVKFGSTCEDFKERVADPPTGSLLYIAAKNTRLWERADALADAVMVVQPGTEVVFLGRYERDDQWARVRRRAKIGFTLGCNLSINKPTGVCRSPERTVDPKAFPSAGATKA